MQRRSDPAASPPDPAAGRSERVLLLMTNRRDAARTADVLAAAGVEGIPCDDARDLGRELERGAGALLLTEEAIFADREGCLRAALAAQPAWSSVPVVTVVREGAAIDRRDSLLSDVAANVTLIERPVRMRTLVSVVRGAVRARRHQYETRDAVAELMEANRRKDQFLATLAHELRNPLAPISNILQAWPLVADDPGRSEEMREMMSRQVRQMVRLIDDLLDVSRISRGKIELRKQRIDLATVVEGALEGVRPFVESCRHELTVETPGEPVTVEGDLGRLMQVIWNLVHNAAKYTGREGHIRLTAGREGDEAVVRVRDDGPGIPPEMLAGIFEMFIQVDQTLDRAHGGLGIGLTLVKTLVEMHGGTVEARSDGPGRGSEFVVRLPVAAGGPAAAERPADAYRDLPPPPRRRVLVVDDVRPSAKTLALMLGGLGQETRTAHDGPAALAAAADFLPDVVLLDIAMPGMDGYEVARRMRCEMNGRTAVLVALTGFGQEEDRRRAFEAGFDHHLVKPTSVDALRQLLSELPTGDAAVAEPAGDTNPSGR